MLLAYRLDVMLDVGDVMSPFTDLKVVFLTERVKMAGISSISISKYGWLAKTISGVEALA